MEVTWHNVLEFKKTNFNIHIYYTPCAISILHYVLSPSRMWISFFKKLINNQILKKFSKKFVRTMNYMWFIFLATFIMQKLRVHVVRKVWCLRSGCESGCQHFWVTIHHNSSQKVTSVRIYSGDMLWMLNAPIKVQNNVNYSSAGSMKELSATTGAEGAQLSSEEEGDKGCCDNH